MSRSDIINELFKKPRRNFKRRGVVVKGINDLLQLDLMDFQEIEKENDSNRYVLTGINAFSKMGYAIPVKNKTAKVVAEATKELLQKAKTKFKLCQTDHGKEFTGPFLKVLADNGIKHYSTFSELKVNIDLVETSTHFLYIFINLFFVLSIG